MLLEQAVAAVARLRNVEAARSGLAEAEALNRLLKDLSTAIQPLVIVCESIRVLRTEGVAISIPPEIERSVQTIVKTTERFRANPASTTLKQGKRWTNLLDALSVIKSTFETSLKGGWTTYSGSQLFSGPPPDDVRRILAQTPSNEANIRRYTELFHKFASGRATVPATADALTRLREYSLQLSAIQFETDVPEDVKAFFQAVATPKGATLDHLTANVITWLTKNGHFENYVVRARVI